MIRFRFAVALVLVFVGWSAVPASADLITIRSGRPLQGEVLEGTEEGIRFRLVDGGELFLAWDLLIDRDVERLKKSLGFIVEEEKEVLVPGVRLVLTDGTVYRGVALPERREGRIHLKQATGPVEIPRERVASLEEIEIPALEAYTPRQLYEMRRGEREPVTAGEHFDLSQYCRRIGDFDKALEHLRAASEVDPEANAEAVRLQIEEVEAILAQKGARDLYDEVRVAARRSQYDAALAALARLEAEFPGSPLIEDLDRRRVGREVLELRRRDFWRARVIQRLLGAVRSLTVAKVREEDLTLAEAKSYAERELADAAVARVARTEGFEEDLVRELWAERGERAKRRATYSDGTFLVEKPKLKESSQPTDRRTQRRTGDRRSSGDRRRGGGSSDPMRNKPTPEEWWERADPGARRDWILAYFAEHSDVMRILRIEYEPCVHCAGRGTLTVLNVEGGIGRILCDRCWGVTHDRIVVFQ